MPRWELFSRGRGRAYDLTGGLPLSSFKGMLRHLGVDAGVVETPYTPEAFARTDKGCGVVVHRDGLQVFSGLIASERSMGWDSERGKATIKVQVLGDNAHLARRIVYPDPARSGAAQSTLAYWTKSGAATSTAMLALISDQLGPAARSERRVPGIYLAEDPGVGPARSWKFRFDNVLEALTKMSIASKANLGVRITTTPDGLRAAVYAPRNKADTIKFSADLSNLHGFDYRQTAPEATYALAGGKGDLTARLLAEYTSAVGDDLAWGLRSEVFVDRTNEDDPAELAQAAADTVTEGAGQTSLTCTLTDSQAARYGLDWGPDPGDLVTVYVGLPGQTKVATVADVVREIALQVNNAGVETIRPAIGTDAATSKAPGLSAKRLAAVARRLATLETRK